MEILSLHSHEDAARVIFSLVLFPLAVMLRLLIYICRQLIVFSTKEYKLTASAKILHLMLSLELRTFIYYIDGGIDLEIISCNMHVCVQK